ncbi:ATP-dependent Zn protease [Azorhizobium sp. AG788]|uniref:AAA family ATPase n=1 Tax=Azorhizobium sp. AG788 TaxID=2183897 RepID=UPI00105CA751|nr:AAA family ATPase [Azorhizobium sp. AG788]TDT92486.1 ATP-dependent Zn protease [Azorhizobium sp. AG788]
MATGKYEKAFRRKANQFAPEMRKPFQTHLDLHQRQRGAAQLIFGLWCARLLDLNPAFAEAVGLGASVATVRAQSEDGAAVVSEVIAPVIGGTFFDDLGRSTSSRGASRGSSKGVRTLEVNRRRNIIVIMEESGSFKKHGSKILTEAIGKGESVLLIWSGEEAFLGDEAMSVRTDALELPLIQPGDLEWLGRISTGGVVCVPKNLDPNVLTPLQIAAAFALGISADECTRRLAVMASHNAPNDDAPPQTTLADLPAFGPATEWGLNLALDLKDYREGRIGWHGVDRGALIEGPPGVGKTTYAKALAATCGVRLIVTSVSAWYAAEHLGETLKIIRSIFADAAKGDIGIIFIDEIDGIGDRANLHHKHRDYVTQVINCLLECMDGAAKREGVVVVGACNFPDRVDPALKRPGRLDRQIRIPMPSIPTLEAIFRYYLQADELVGVDLEPLATIAHGFTGADVEQCVRTARRRARRAGRGLILEDLVAEIRGPVSDLSAANWWRIAIHESGHAFVAIALGLSTSVNVQIGRSNFTHFETSHDGMTTRETCLRMVRYILAGRAAEQEIVGDVSAGGGGPENSDLGQATRLIAALEGSLGLGAGGHLTWWAEADATQRLLLHPRISVAVEKTLAELHADTVRIIRQHRETVIKVANELLKRQRLSGSELTDLIGPIHLSTAADTQAASEANAT